MIVKYLNNDVWGYIDNVRQAASKLLDVGKLIEEYQKSYGQTSNDPCEYMNGERLEENVIKSNKAFTVAWDEVAELS